MDSVHNKSNLLQEIFASRLEDWRKRLYYEVTPIPGLTELGTRAWTTLWKRAWAQYEELEKDRISAGFARLTWQDHEEEGRRGLEYFIRKHLVAINWSKVPLGTFLDNCLFSPVSPHKSHVTRALDRWHKFREVAAQHPNFERSLSFTQKTSWTLLTHWWSAAYQDPNISEAAKLLLKNASAHPNSVKIIHDEPYLNTETFEQTRRSVYNATMYALFDKEFNPRWWNNGRKEIRYVILSMIRAKGIQHAAAQRLAYSSYAEMKQLKLPDIGPYVCSVDLPCPWLPKEQRRKEKPFYLWDVKRRQTVKVEDLRDEPEYCCVSHTWGRWRMNDDVHIQGVPWPVPRNGRFDVESLPEHLQRIQPRVTFVWIDLFCIPQDGSPKAEDEINRQALIFQNASRCIAWMNDVLEWTRTWKALNWIAISYLHTTTSPGIYDTKSLLGRLYSEAQDVSELFPHEIEVPEGEKLKLDSSNPRAIIAIGGRKLAEPASWFSSLWTLQEAMLCPSLIFVSRDWAPFEDCLGTPIPLDAFFGILKIVQEAWYDDKPYKSWTGGPIQNYSRLKLSQEIKPFKSRPSGAKYLYSLCSVTRMHDLLESPEPAGLLIGANTRQSTSSRAPAIMSALGITDWYKPNDSSHDLVLDCYPLPFVREAATKLGARFYGAGEGVRKFSYKRGTLHSGLDCSMMPFARRSGCCGDLLRIPMKYGHLHEDHPAVQTWVIQQDGSVSIEQAGILASTEDGLDNESVLRVFGYDRGKPIRFIDWVNDLPKVPKGMLMFAVSSLRNCGRQQGLVVRGCREHFHPPAQHLMKVGNFIISEPDFPPTTKVNWRVW